MSTPSAPLTGQSTVTLPQDQSLARQMRADGSLPDMPATGIPMRAVVAAAAVADPDAEAHTQKLAQQAGMGVDLTRSNPQAAQQRALASDLDRRELEITNPILARQLSDPNFAAVAHDDLDSLSRIEQGAGTIRAMTSQEAFDYRFNRYIGEPMMKFPLTRAAVGVVAGAEGMVGDIGSFLGLHGSGPTRQNFFQRMEQQGTPEHFGLPSNQLDTVARTVGPMLPAFGVGAAADALGLSENGAKVLAALGVGSAFTASQGGRTFTEMAAAGKSDAEARHDADLVAGINAVPNIAMGLTDFVPGLNRSPLLAALGVGGVTGASGQLAQNLVTGKRLTTDLGKGALEGAAVQGGMHLGFDFLGQMGETISAVEASKLRTRQPAAFQKYLDAQFDGDSSVRIPAQEFVDYFTQKNLDPAAVAHQVGATNLEEAAAAGSDLEIPKANFFGRLDPEHQKGLLPDVIDPATELTAKQSEAGRAELEEFVSSGRAAQLAAEFQQADEETKASPEWQKVYSDLKQRYVDAGETEPAADNYATLQANAISYLAKNAGMKPDEMLALHNPKVVAGGTIPDVTLHQGPADNSAQPEKQTAAGAIGEPRFSDSDLEVLRDRLGNGDDAPISIPVMRWHDESTHLGLGGTFFHVDNAAARSEKNLYRAENTEGFRANAKPQYATVEIGHPFFFEGRSYHHPLPSIDLEDSASAILRDLAGVNPNDIGDWTDDDELGLPAGTVDRVYREHSGAEALDAVAMEVLRSRGYDGAVQVPDGNHQFAEVIKLKPSESFPALSNGAVLYQASPAEPGAGGDEGTRGWMRLVSHGPDRLPSVEIGKTKIGDFSTFIHEPAHAYLELFRDLTQRGEVSEALKGDFQKITEWLGTTPEEVYKNGFTREQHEQWARANEQYVREGKAPTSALRRVFQGFGVWLQRIYRQASALGVELSGDIRGVMDRLYAGENAVERAEQEAGEQKLFTSPEEAGWTEAEYRNYAEANGIAVEKAREQVASELNEAAEREHTQQFREEKANVRDAVTAEIDARPEYTAIRSLRRGALDDGTEMTLNKDALVQQFGEERVKALQKLHRGLYRNEGGTDAETAAELFGFHSGEEMLRALEAAPRRGQAIEAATREYLVNKYGDVRYDGTLNDRARFAIENKERAGIIYRELRALRAKLAGVEKKAADAKAAMAAITIEPLEHYEEAARAMIDQKAVADLQPYRYLNASRKYSRDAFDALRSGNVRKAAEAKNKELLNHFLFREASEARDYADKFEKYTKVVQRPTAQQKLGLADQNAKQAGGVGDYRDQHNWLLARYRLRSGDPSLSPRPERSLRDWTDAMYSDMKEPAIADSILSEGSFADWRSVPMSELRELHDALVNIRHLGKLEYEVLVNGKRMQLEQMAKELDEGIRANMKVRPEKVFERKTGLLRGLARSVDVMSSRMEFLVNRWDGGKRSFWRKYIWDRYEDAKGDEFAMQADFTRAVNDAVEKEAGRQGLRLTEKVMVDGIPPSEDELTRKHLVSMALNMGNASNLDRLRKTFQWHGWDPEAIRRIGGMLKPEEWRFVQGVWDALKPWGERMKAFEKQQTGLAPVMVEVKPFKVVLDDGTELDLAGGYYPVKYDSRHVAKGYEEDATKSARNLMERGYGRATTSRNYTKERSRSAGPLLLDYERVLTEHIAKVTKDLSHRAFAQSVNQLLLHPRVRQALRETQGPGADQDAMAWLRSTVNDRNGSIDGGPNDIRPYLMKLRSNLVKASLAFKGSTSLLQFTHLPRLMTFTNPKAYTQAMVDFWKNPIEMTRAVREMSPNEMRFRGENLTRDYRATLQEVAKKKGLAGAGLRFGYAAFRYVDHAVSFPLWLSVYNDTLLKNGPEMGEEESHRDAVHAADSAVRMGLGTGTTGDLPPIMRSPDLWKQFETTLWGFENLNYNIFRHKVGGDAARSFRAGAYGAAAGGLTYGLAMTFFLPAIISSYVRGDGPEDGESWGLWAAKRSLFFGMGTIMLVKDAGALFEYGSDRSLNPVAGIAGRGIEDARRSAREENPDWSGLGIDALETIGDVLGVEGTAEAAHIARYIHRANEGKIENPNPYGAIVGGH